MLNTVACKLTLLVDVSWRMCCSLQLPSPSGCSILNTIRQYYEHKLNRAKKMLERAMQIYATKMCRLGLFVIIYVRFS